MKGISVSFGKFTVKQRQARAVGILYVNTYDGQTNDFTANIAT